MYSHFISKFCNFCIFLDLSLLGFFFSSSFNLCRIAFNTNIDEYEEKTQVVVEENNTTVYAVLFDGNNLLENKITNGMKIKNDFNIKDKVIFINKNKNLSNF